MRIGLTFDLRNPEPWYVPWPEHYGRTLDVIAEADRLGLDIVKLTEHHLIPDGYIPQPLVFMSAIAAMTRQIRVSTGVLIAPLHSAVEIAEQAAVVDCISGGRVELALGTGYRKPEYDLYGVDFSRRLAILGERVDQIRDLWSRDGGTTPRPVQDEIPLWAGVRGPRASRLAGRLGMARLHLEPENWDEYLAGIADGGRPTTAARFGGSLHAFLAEDPERTTALIADRIEYHRNAYAQAAIEGTGATGVADAPAVSRPGLSSAVRVATPEQVVEMLNELAGDRTVDTIYIHGTIAGVVDELVYENVKLAANRLKPLLAAESPAPQPTP